MSDLKDGVTIGIDLGTRNALCACVDEGGRPMLIRNRRGRFQTPSVVSWDNGWLVGEDAIRFSLLSDRPVWWDIKRRVGSGFRARCNGREYTAEELLVPLFSVLREDAEAFKGEFISSCVLAVPACFTLLQREALSRSAEAAGLHETRIISEPTAAALAFGGEGRFLVLDFGAGTVDVSVVESEDGVWQVLESTGATSVGGYDFDLALAEWLRERLCIAPLSREDPVWRTLVLEAETIKITLSGCRSCSWTPPPLQGREYPPFQIEREELERLMRFSIRRVVHLVNRLWDRYEPERLLLVGGSSRIPLLREILEKETAVPERLSLCAEESIALGAALCASAGKERLLLDVLSSDVGFIRGGEATVLIAAGTPLPFSAKASFVPKRSEKASLSIFQDRGDLKSERAILSAVDFDARAGEEVSVSCVLDTSGLLRLSLGNGRTAIDVPLIPPGQKSNVSPEGRRQQLRRLKLRLTPLEILLSVSQQDRLHNLVSQIENAGNDNIPIEILEDLVNDLEAVLSS
ncbi:MAG: Hsp70 family protein [Synergistaceae bacterium]|jgi:molecular chaperone DnaK (HSP70)|nr:Hsp70 family protein [Synergistaceae bacterium]